MPSWSPAYPAFSLLFCPLYRRGRIDSPAPIPLPALAERSSRREGGDYKFILPGASPLAYPRLSRKRHGLNLRGKYPEGEGGVPARQERAAGDRAESHAGSGKERQIANFLYTSCIQILLTVDNRQFT